MNADNMELAEMILSRAVVTFTASDRENALLILADDCKSMGPSPRDLQSLADFVSEGP